MCVECVCAECVCAECAWSVYGTPLTPSAPVQSAFIRKLRFVTKKLAIAEKKLTFFKNKGYDVHTHQGKLTVEDSHADEIIEKEVKRATSIQPGTDTDTILRLSKMAMGNAMAATFEEGEEIDDASFEGEEEDLTESDLNENMQVSHTLAPSHTHAPLAQNFEGDVNHCSERRFLDHCIFSHRLFLARSTRTLYSPALRPSFKRALELANGAF